MKRIVCLEGCHGVGKSTILALLGKRAEGYDLVPEKFRRIGSLTPTRLITESAWISRWFKKVAEALCYGDSDVVVADRSPYSALMYCDIQVYDLLHSLIKQNLGELKAAYDFTLHVFMVSAINEDELLLRIEKRLKCQPERKNMSEDDATRTLMIHEKYARDFTGHVCVNPDDYFVNYDARECADQIAEHINDYK